MFPSNMLLFSAISVGWIRLQNGYYLPIHSDDGKIPFLHKVSTRTQPQNSEMKRIGSGTPLFRAAEQEDLASLLGGTVGISPSSSTAVVEPRAEEAMTSSQAEEVKQNVETTRAAVHMDAMAFGMGCCCLQITFQAKDLDESRFIYDQLAVMAPM